MDASEEKKKLFLLFLNDCNSETQRIPLSYFIPVQMFESCVNCFAQTGREGDRD